jgi:hypothetical protein
MGGGLGARARSAELLARLNLAALFVPGVLGVAGWCALAGDPRVAWLGADGAHFWTIACAGTLATFAGVADWRLHRRGVRYVSAHERKVELAALAGGGAPLFAAMAWATLSDEPGFLLVPIVALGLATTVAIAYDELAFHRRCARVETLYHRLLTMGMGVAWLAWLHGVFVARWAHA